MCVWGFGFNPNLKIPQKVQYIFIFAGFFMSLDNLCHVRYIDIWKGNWKEWWWFLYKWFFLGLIVISDACPTASLWQQVTDRAEMPKPVYSVVRLLFRRTHHRVWRNNCYNQYELAYMHQRCWPLDLINYRQEYTMKIFMYILRTLFQMI